VEVSVVGDDIDLTCDTGTPPPPTCADPEPDTQATASSLGSVSGDTGSDVAGHNGSICPSDEDWFSFALTENHADPFPPDTPLTAQVTLTMSGGGGDLDLCVVNLTTLATSCSTLPGTATETVNINVPTSITSEDTTGFAIQVNGFTLSSENDYTLEINGNT
jgi:hypothetical protein